MRTNRFQRAQRALWWDVRETGVPWRISDLITVGTPMYMAPVLYTRNEDAFQELVARGELAVCPPIWDPELPITGHSDAPRERRITWAARPILHESASFAIVRWTNMWFPPAAGFFGDWFGGPLAEVFGPGVNDIPLTGNLRHGRLGLLGGRLVPALAHARYFDYATDETPGSVTKILRNALDLGASTFRVAPLAGRTAADEAEPRAPASTGV